MSEELRKEIEELKQLVTRSNPKTIEESVYTSSKFLRWITSAISIFAVIVGLGINWGMTKAELSTVATQITQIKEDHNRKESFHRTETEKLKKEVIELKIKDAADEQWKKSTTQVLQEIQQTVKDLAQQDRRSR